MSPLYKTSKQQKIASWHDWDKVTPIYSDYKGDTGDRDHPGAVLNPAIRYINKTGRNDFVTLKVARDNTEIFFLAETAGPIISGDDETWMRLYINSDRNHTTGWMGYDLRINNGKELQKYDAGRWQTISKVRVRREGNQLMYSFPLKLILEQNETLDFEFKWSDNMQQEDPMDWYINGDVAPGGRFNFVYKTE